MKEKFKITCIFITVLFFSSCGLKNRDKETWMKFHSKEGKFNILVPNRPSIENNDTLFFPIYGKVIHKQFIFHETNNDSLAYAIQFDDYPEYHFNNEKSKIDTFYIKSLENIQSVSNGVINYHSTVKYHEYNGRETLMTTNGNRKIIIRSFIIEGRHYFLMVNFPNSYIERMSNIYKFLDSFELIE